MELDEFYRIFNDYETNPLSEQNDAEKQSFLRKNRLHTSLSEGDVLFVDHKGWYCNYEGWRVLE